MSKYMGITGKGRKHRGLLRMATAAFMMTVFLANGTLSFADSTGTVTESSVKIRKEASTSSDVIGSSTQGKTVTIKDEVTDASGTLWYQVYVDGNTLGYVRADLIKKEGGETNTASQTTETDSNTADTAQETANTNSVDGATSAAETAMDAQYATVAVEAAKIRTAPSTNDAVVESLSQNTQLVVSGQSNGSDGKVWYYVTFTGSNGAEKTGFVRSDLVTLGEMLPQPEEETPVEEAPAEETETPQEPVNNDYELVYTTDADGNYVWYLYNNMDSTRQKLDEVLAAAHAQSANEQSNADTVVKQRIVIIVLIVLLVILAVTVLIMSFKLRDAYYESYEDDEEEEEDEEAEEEPEEEVPAKKRRRRERIREEEDEDEDEEEEKPPVRQRKRVPEETGRIRAQKPEKKPVVREVEYHEEPSTDVPVKPAPKKKAKNFLLDDDDFEFEFLNMDSKDL